MKTNMGKEKELSPAEKFCKANPKKDCPERIVSNATGGLVLGFFGGVVYRVVTDLARNNGIERAAQGALSRAPIIAVSSGIVLAVYTALECATERLRGQRDDANCFIAGAATGALLGPGDPTRIVPNPMRTEPCYGGGSSGHAGPASILSRVPRRLLNAILGAIAFGVIDGVLRSEVCEKNQKKSTDKKSKAGDKTSKK